VHIGLTFDLRSDYLAAGYGDEDTAEFDGAATIEALAAALVRLGHRVERIGNVRALARCLADGRRFDLVFNICEGLAGYGREAQVPALLDAFELPYTFAEPLGCALTLHKGMAKHVLRGAGVPTPDFAVVESAAQAHSIDLPLPLFVKPVAEGTGKGVDGGSVVRERAQLAPVCARLIERYRQPALVERFLPGREFTVGLIGSGDAAYALGTLEVTLLDSAEPGAYTYTNKEECETRVRYTLLPDGPERERIEALALAAWRVLLGRDAGRVDLRLDEHDAPQVMELNPLAGLHPEHSDLPILCTQLGIGYDTLIGWIVESAAQRCTSMARPRRTALAS
jgi:D-alanine-D-alanine ligase